MAQIEKQEFSFPDETATQESDEDKLEIEVMDDTPEVDRGRAPMKDAPKDLTDDELSKYDESVKSRIKHFSKGYHDERRAKETAQREQEEAFKLASALVEENKRLRGSLSEGQTALIGQAKRLTSSELETAKKKYKDAYESGDADAVLEAQQEITQISIRSDKLENFKPAPLQPSESEVKTEQRVNAPKLDDKLTSWQSENKWFGSNQRMTAYALALHTDLLAEGIPVGSDKYYEKLDTDLRKRFPENFDEVGGDDAKPQTRTRSNVVAPATRSTAARKVVLTRTQVNTAKRLGVPLELYARKVAELEGN
jgi:hypothetical protein